MKKKLRGNSIARRLNAALTRRSFAKTILIDILAACLVMATWCLTVENSNGAKLAYTQNRGFVADEKCDVLYNTYRMTGDLQEYFVDLSCGVRPEIEWTLPFDGIYYTFRIQESSDTAEIRITEKTEDAGVEYETETIYPYTTEDDLSDEPTVETSEIGDGEVMYSVYSVNSAPKYKTCKVDASVILTLTTCCTLIVMLLQTLSAIIKTLSGGGLIKRYLRPIDDLAIMAEQLSSESHTTSRNEVRASYSSENGTDSSDESIEQNEPKFHLSDVEELTDAFNEIDDSRKRIDIQAPELSGLEAAVNNMLKRLEEGKRKQIRFVDDASHELRTPISVIQGYANMLDRWGKDDPKVRDEAIEAIKNESEHIKTLLDQLLFLARGEMDRHVLELKPLSVDEILCEVMEESQMLDGRHKYELYLASGGKQGEDDVDFEAKDVKILADAAMIKQSVRILCDNAVKYTPEGGTIILKASERVSANVSGEVCREVCIEVIDTGIGISANELPRIFDRFYRGQNARSDNAGGSGLGLSIARWIVEQHHGRIEAISSIGFGTKMTIILPEYEDEKQQDEI